MLYAKQDQEIIQRIQLLMLRKREENAGTGIFYSTDLRREVLVPVNNTQEAWLQNQDNWAAAAGLSSKINGQFTDIPQGMKTEHLYMMLGTVISKDPIRINTVEGTEVASLNPEGLTCSFEILASDALLLQEQNQQALIIDMDAFVQFNAQDYGEGFDPDGRDREILRGSLWAVPQHYRIGVSRPELRSAATSAVEIHSIAEKAKEKNTQRALLARSQSFADRSTKDEQRALNPMPPRRGTNTSVQMYGGARYGKS